MTGDEEAGLVRKLAQTSLIRSPHSSARLAGTVAANTGTESTAAKSGRCDGDGRALMPASQLFSQ